MVKNLLISICLILISSCSTLAFWSDDDVDNLKPVELKSIQKDFSISVEWKKSLKGESNLSSFKPSYYSGNMLVADPEGNIVSLNPKTGKENWKIGLDRQLSAGIASGFGKLIVSDVNGFVLPLILILKKLSGKRMLAVRSYQGQRLPHL